MRKLAGLRILGWILLNWFLVSFASENLVSLEPRVNVVSLEEVVNVTLNCKANLTRAKYQWLKDGKAIMTEDKENRFYSNKNGSLTIDKLRETDAGSYRCLATGNEGTALSNPGKLVIAYLNKFQTRTNGFYEAEEGSGIAIPCEGVNYAPVVLPKVKDKTESRRSLSEPRDARVNLVGNSVSFFWQDNEHHRLYENLGKNDYYVSQNDGTLYFSNTARQDRAIIYCFIRAKQNGPNRSASEQNSKNVYLQVTPAARRNAPRMLLEPKNVTFATVGSSVTLECFAGGNPTPTLKWTKINGSFPPNHVITEAGQLELHDVSHDVTGTYRCTASNDLGIVTTQGDVIVSEPVTYKRRMLSQFVDYYKSAKFRCEASGIPPPTYKWLKNGAPINMTSRVNVNVGTKGGSVMTITEVGDDDVAIYQCVAENPLGSFISNAVLGINEMAPHFITAFQQNVVKSPENSFFRPKNGSALVIGEPLEVLADSDLIITCVVDGYPKPSVCWAKNGESITKNVKTSYNGSLTIGILSLSNIFKSDEGNYSCTAANYKGATPSFKILLVYEPTVVVSVNDTVEVLRGNTATLRCRASHDERLKIIWRWTRDDLEIVKDKMSFDQGFLQIEKVAELNVGAYKCCVSTRLNRGCASIHLVVADLPTSALNVDVINSTNTSQYLTWDKQTSENDEKYKVEGRLEQEDNWFSFNCDVNKPCLASNLLPYNEYVYRVYSINKYGISTASEISKPQRTKGGAPSMTPSGVKAIIRNGNLSVTWDTYPSKYFGSAKIFYAITFRNWHKTLINNGTATLQNSKWFEHNETKTKTNATSTLAIVTETENVVWYDVKLKVCNEFGPSPFSKEIKVTVAGAQAKTESNLLLTVVLIFILSAVALVFLIVLAVYFIRRRKAKQFYREPKSSEELVLLISNDAFKGLFEKPPIFDRNQGESKRPDEIFSGPQFDSFIQKYVELINEGKFQEAIQAVDLQFKSLKFQATAKELEAFTKSLRVEKKYTELILFFLILSRIFSNDSKPDNKVTGIRWCAWGMRLTSKIMNDRNAVRHHVLPLMRDMATLIEETQVADPKARVLQLVWCLRHIEKSEAIIGDLESRERNLKRAISLMQETYGHEEASKHRVYANCLNNLGFVCEETLRLEESKKNYEQALAAHKKAEDVSKMEKEMWIQDTKNNLRKCMTTIKAKDFE